MQARKAVTDIERRPHQAVRAYSSSEEREVLVKASQVRGNATSSCTLSAKTIYHDHASTYGVERTPSIEARITQSGSKDHSHYAFDRNKVSVLDTFYCRLHRAPSASMQQPQASVAGCTRPWATESQMMVP